MAKKHRVGAQVEGGDLSNDLDAVDEAQAATDERLTAQEAKLAEQRGRTDALMAEYGLGSLD